MGRASRQILNPGAGGLRIREVISRFLRRPGVFVRLAALIFIWERLWLEYVLLLYPGPHIAGFTFGDDFILLHTSAGLVLAGRNPYFEPISPLPSAFLVPLALHALTYAHAFLTFKFINAGVVLAAMLWLCRELRLSRTNIIFVLLITLVYGPASSIVGEGNLDALMAGLLVAACSRHRWLGAVAWGLSIGTKFYSLLLLPIYAMQRRWKDILFALTALAIVLLPFLRWLPEWLHAITGRTSTFFITGNVSPAVLFIDLFGLQRRNLWRVCYLLLWGGTLAVRIWRDRTPSPERVRWQPLYYIPWMAAAPLLVYYYTGVILLPFVALLAATNQRRPLRATEWLIGFGFLLTGIYPWVFNLVLPFPDPFLQRHDVALRAIVPLGIALMLLGNAFAPIDDPREHSTA